MSAAGVTQPTRAAVLARNQLLIELSSSTARVAQWLEEGYRKVVAAVELTEADNVDKVTGELQETGAGEGTVELAELRHRMLVLRNSLKEIDPQTIAIAEFSTHELASTLDALSLDARSEIRVLTDGQKETS